MFSSVSSFLSAHPSPDTGPRPLQPTELLKLNKVVKTSFNFWTTHVSNSLDTEGEKKGHFRSSFRAAETPQNIPFFFFFCVFFFFAPENLKLLTCASRSRSSTSSLRRDKTQARTRTRSPRALTALTRTHSPSERGEPTGHGSLTEMRSDTSNGGGGVAPGNQEKHANSKVH